MSLVEYDASNRIPVDSDTFYAMIMAAMRCADTFNLEKLKGAFPDTWEELQARYNAPRGLLPGESDAEGWRRDADGNLYEPGGEMVRAA